MKFTNEQQFLDHTKRHIVNVNLLANALYNSFEKSKILQKEFNITRKEIVEFKSIFKKIMKNHDKSKVCDDEYFLLKHNLKEPNFKKLYSFSGISLDIKNTDFISKLNNIDFLETNSLFKENNTPIKLQKIFLKIEYLSDLVERGCNPISNIEFGRQIKRASDFNTHLRNKRDSIIINSLEKYYDKNILKSQLTFQNDLFRNKNESTNENLLNSFLCKRINSENKKQEPIISKSLFKFK